MGCNDYKIEYLKSYLGIINKLKLLAQQKSSLEATIDNVKSFQITGMPSSHKKKDLSDVLVKLEEANNKLIDTYVDRVEAKTNLEMLINELDNTKHYGDIIHMKYIEQKTWSQIASDIGLSVKQVTRLHGEALNIISDEDIPSEFKDPN